MKYTLFLEAVVSAALVTSVSAHGYIASPAPRMPGPAMAAACGQQVYNNQAADHYGNVQGEMQISAGQQDYNPTKCDLHLCKGYQFADSNSSQIHSFTAGQVIPIVYEIHAPHTGIANVSIVDTATNTMISQELKSWSTYASNAVSIPQDELQFSITMPNLGSKCTQPGACVIQHWWDATSINQTYEACIDFTQAGSGAASGSTGAPVSSAAAVSASAPAPVSSAAAVSANSAVATSVAPSVSVPLQQVTTLLTSVTSAAAAPTPTATTQGGDDEEDSDCEEE